MELRTDGLPCQAWVTSCEIDSCWRRSSTSGGRPSALLTAPNTWKSGRTITAAASCPASHDVESAVQVANAAILRGIKRYEVRREALQESDLLTGERGARITFGGEQHEAAPHDVVEAPFARGSVDRPLDRERPGERARAVPCALLDQARRDAR